MEFWPEYLANSWGKEFIAGGLGGMAGVIAGHPLDTIRIHLQQPSALGPSSAGAVVRRLLATEGPFGFFKGLSSPLATIAFQNAVSFQTYALLSRALANNGDEPLPLKKIALAGIGAGTLQTVILTPVDLVKIHLQLHTAHRSSPSFIRSSRPVNLGPLEVTRCIMQREGLRGLYRGLTVTVLRDAPSHGVYFGTYEYLREYLHPGCRKNGDESVSTMLTAGGFAGAISWISCYPLDVVKSRLQAQGPDNQRYRGIIDCMSKSVHEEGISVLFRGLGTTVARAFLVNGAIFSAYEMSLRLLFSQTPQDNMLESPI